MNNLVFGSIAQIVLEASIFNQRIEKYIFYFFLVKVSQLKLSTISVDNDVRNVLSALKR